MGFIALKKFMLQHPVLLQAYFNKNTGSEKHNLQYFRLQTRIGACCTQINGEV